MYVLHICCPHVYSADQQLPPYNVHTPPRARPCQPPHTFPAHALPCTHNIHQHEGAWTVLQGSNSAWVVCTQVLRNHGALFRWCTYTLMHFALISSHSRYQPSTHSIRNSIKHTRHVSKAPIRRSHPTNERDSPTPSLQIAHQAST